ncbi:hypothetical protein [Hyphobacterium sp.]|jgi:hypothetical protein|uniref:hypothetical protein n=1 Tax=Hyphobacterium sp. TaxID=2004662 RepID=UPI003BACAD6B
MKLATTGLVLAMVLSPAAMAQVTDLTGSVQGQTQSTLSTNTSQTARGSLSQGSRLGSRLDQQTDIGSRLDQQTDLDSRLDRQTDLDSRLDQQTDIDSRLDSTVDSAVNVDESINANADASANAYSRIGQSLQSSLSAYDRSRASSRLASQLEQRSQVYAGGSVSADTPDRPSVYTGTGSAYVSSNSGGYSQVAVYSRDGYRIGTVTRYDSDTNGRIHFDRSGIDTDGVVAVSESDAMFDADAQAIVLNATRADVSGMASVG